jgi:hypothetical protein
MKSVIRAVAFVVVAALLFSGDGFAATYQASAEASIQFLTPGAVAVGDDITFVSDYFYPELLAGNAGFNVFGGFGRFNTAEQRMFLSLGGPSGFANPYGISRSRGSEGLGPVVLRNLTEDEFSYPLQLEYSFSLSASAAEKEAASSSVEIDLFIRYEPSQSWESIFHLDRALSQNGSDSGNTFRDVPVILQPGGEVELLLAMKTFGEASAVSEPATVLTGCTVFALVVMRARQLPRRR